RCRARVRALLAALIHKCSPYGWTRLMNTAKRRELRVRKSWKSRPRRTTARNTRATAPTEQKILKAINGASCILFEMRGPAVRTDLDQTLIALADPARRAIVELLRERPLRPSEVADVLEMTRPAMSRHLRVCVAQQAAECSDRHAER